MWKDIEGQDAVLFFLCVARCDAQRDGPDWKTDLWRAIEADTEGSCRLDVECKAKVRQYLQALQCTRVRCEIGPCRGVEEVTDKEDPSC